MSNKFYNYLSEKIKNFFKNSEIRHGDKFFIQFDEEYTPTSYLFPYVKFTQFSITNKWVGLLCDVKIYIIIRNNNKE